MLRGVLCIVGLSGVLLAACTPFGSDDVTTTDAGANVADVADVAADGAPCGHDFCADFEGSLKDGWDKAPVFGMGMVSQVPSKAGSGTAFRSTIPAQPSGTLAAATVLKGFDTAKGLHVDVDVYVEPTLLSTGGNFAILQVTGGPSQERNRVVVYINKNTPTFGFFLAPNATSTAATTPRSTIDFPEGTWVHLVVDVSFGSGGRVSVDVAGTNVFDQLFASEAPTNPTLSLGLQRYNEATPALSATFDSVKVDLKKP